jgi:3-oxoacyl-[acyl-carrier protein] reductase
MTSEISDGGGPAVLLAGPESKLASDLATALRATGAKTAVLSGDSLSGREQAIDAVASVADQLGSLDAVVYVPAIAEGLTDRILADTDEDRWDAEAEAPIRTAYFVIQGAHEHFEERGGSIVAVIPSIALTGAAGLVPFATAAEGIRLLIKSAARAWGKRRIRVNTVTAPIEAWGYEQSPEHKVPSRYGPAMPDTDSLADIAGAVALLASPLSAGVSGATIGVDHATVMAP